MNTILKYALIFMGAYFAINWMADNPTKVETFRAKVNSAVTTGSAVAANAINEMTQ